jgi:uncharacterized phage protein gp47/JayE
MSGTTTPSIVTINLPTPPVCTIDSTGIHIPTFPDILNYFTEGYQAIYGSDVYLGSDSQDGELIGLLAAAYNDANTMATAAYNSFSPQSAQGTGLSSVVKINGISRLVPTNSMVDVIIIGVTGTPIINAVVGDGTYRWDLPTATIPNEGQITVTAVCETSGAVAATANTVVKILTPISGWQSVNNPADALLGQPVESDPTLTKRQTVSTMLPSLTVLDGIVGAVSSITGVARLQPYENDTDTTDSNGLPSHSISLVVDGGDAQTIANTIALKKTPGAGTYGSTSQNVIDSSGVQHTINFWRPIEVTITVTINLHNLTGYTSIIGNNIINSVVNYINSLSIGQSVLMSRVFVPANLMGPFAILTAPADPTSFELISVLMSRVESTTLSGAISNTTINTIDLSDSIGFPLLSPYLIQIDSETMLVTGGQGTAVWVVVRGYNGSSAATHSNSATVTLLASQADVILAFNEAATISATNVTLNVA